MQVEASDLEGRKWQNIDFHLPSGSAGVFCTWYEKNGLSYPWRREGVSPFKILLTEMLLRRTKAPMVARIWHELVESYPTANSVAAAGPRALEGQIAVLGLRRQRAEAITQASTWIAENGGDVPCTLNGLLSIPHIGLYSAHAVLCFAFGHQVPIVDANVLRVLSRYSGLSLGLDIRRCKGAWAIATNLLPPRAEETRKHNYGLLDFCSLVCKPQRPVCQLCPITVKCCYASCSSLPLTDTHVT